MAKKTETQNEGNMEMNAKIDVATLTASELAKLLAAARQAEKAKEDAEKALPQHAYIVVLSDSTLIYWSGRAATVDDAEKAAKDYASSKAGEGVTVFSMCIRPVPQPRGRKAKA